MGNKIFLIKNKILREGVKNILRGGGPSILGGYWPYSLFLGGNRPFLVHSHLGGHDEIDLKCP